MSVRTSGTPAPPPLKLSPMSPRIAGAGVLPAHGDSKILQWSSPQRPGPPPQTPQTPQFAGSSPRPQQKAYPKTCHAASAPRAAVQSSVPVAEAQTPPVPSAIRRALTPPPATTSQEAQTRISNLEQVVQELRGDLHRQRADAQRQEEKVESLSQIVRRLDAQVTLHPAPREELPSAAVASSVSPDFKELKQIMEQTLIELEMLSRRATDYLDQTAAASMKHIQELRRRAAGVASRTDEGQVPAAINTQDLAFDDVSEATCFSPGRHADLLASSPTTLALQPDDGTCSPPRRLSGDSEMTCPPGCGSSASLSPNFGSQGVSHAETSGTGLGQAARAGVGAGVFCTEEPPKEREAAAEQGDRKSVV